MAKEGKTISWNKKTNTGWKYQNGKWVQYKGGKTTGRTTKNRLGTTTISALNPKQTEKGRSRIAKNQNQSKGGGAANAATLPKSTNKSKLTFKNMKEAGLLDKKSKSTTTSKKSADSEKAAWLKKTRNSPAAKSGAFTDEQRWAQQVKHRDSQAARKAKTEAKKNKLKVKGDTQGKSMPSNPKGMRQEGVGKTAKDLTRHTTGSSETKKKKKKKLTKNEIKYPTRGTFRGI